MSWSLFLVPAHRMSADSRAWANIDGDLVESEPLPLPTVEQVLAALVAAGCHGDAWYRLEGLDDPLPRCADSERCVAEHEHDLGEVSLHCGRDLAWPVRPDDLVECLSMRKPGAGSLPAAIALAALAGTLITFDDTGPTFFAVRPGRRFGDLRRAWPW